MITFDFDVPCSEWSRAAKNQNTGIIALGSIIGSTKIIFGDCVIERKPTRVIMDCVQLSNAFSETSFNRYRGDTLSVAINDETEFYVTYGSNISLRLLEMPNVYLQINRREAFNISSNIAKRTINLLEKNTPWLVVSYEMLLLDPPS